MPVCMLRMARVVVFGVAHQITRPGNRQQDVFLTDDNRCGDLTWIGDRCRRFDIAIHGRFLMTNHVHLIMIPANAEEGRRLGTAHLVRFAALVSTGFPARLARE